LVRVAHFERITQGTYAPDATYRWMGSMAMDKLGDIALGYSASSGTVYPGIRYTGRVPSDTLGTMEAETVIQAGLGAQTKSLNRWGDYSALSVDPVDDCTFWYTNEYLQASGTFNWSTRIASFRFPNCPAVVPSPTATTTSTPTGSPTATLTAAPTLTSTPTNTSTATSTSVPPTATQTATNTPTATNTSTSTPGTKVSTAPSTQQYTLTGSDGTSWVNMDPNALALTLTPTTSVNAILSVNSDLWTSSVGYNQDIGIWISGGSFGSGQVIAWKESGGPATNSPNAAYLQTVVPLSSGTTYTVKLVWKSNTADPGTIWAGAGAGSPFSPTRLTAELIPTATTVSSAVSTQQYTVTGSDGSTWTTMDASKLLLTLSPSVNSTAVLSGNSDLWTSATGYNQDLGVWISGGSYGSGQVVAWKESGGPARNSPNAAYVEVPVPLTGGTTYTVKLVWKANTSDPGTIWAGAGAGSPFSPTRLTAEVIPGVSTTIVADAVSTQQYTLSGSDGSTWTDLDPSKLSMTLAPTVNSTVDLSGNSDLWTSSVGYNQDLGIWISGGSYGSGQLVAWKESGGPAKNSPNAAYVQTIVNLTAGTTYTVKLRWKANTNDPGTIWAGAGAGSPFSPTRLTAVSMVTVP
jgi:hypothetical protein